ncbi:tachykinins [Papilio machaon]|uniref:tachykinins n=1 Tax=Papilio machaon TaxID=76193 RepID=UPI001E6643CD|nr:tachykinins [Papilio machaon]
MIPPKTCLLFIIINLICMAIAQDMEKRVPQGFLGMRGKKYLDSEEIGEFYKRKPQFFVGVKGKKNYAEPDIYDKRARMGFFGMRGKKEYPELLFPDSYPQRVGSLFGQIEYAANELPINQEPLDDLITDYIQKLQGSNLSPEHIDTEIIPDESEMTNEVDKRAKLHQFYGVRGKKSVQNKRPYDLSFRGKFIGVRGKKDVKNAQEIKFLLGENGPWPKRKAQMGFFGMRGKKWTDESSPEETPY